VFLILNIALTTDGMAGTAAENSRDRKIEELERMIMELSQDINELKEEQAQEKALKVSQEKRVSKLATKVEKISSSRLLNAHSWVNKFTIGGYGEMHANFGESKSSDQFDIHRLVLYLGYDFNDWIKFSIEHAFVSDGSGGELSMEQAYIDLLLSEPISVRFGRILTPLGIINKKHEPPSFYGVERPSFSKYIIPTTWSSDGIGIFGKLTSSLKYEAYVVGGLDGSKFDALNGIRKGRIKERPSLHDPAFTGRLDYYPFVSLPVGYGQTLRLGASTYIGGIDNGNQGKNPDVDGDIQVYSGDFEYTLLDFDFRGAIAYEKIDGAGEIGNGTASEILGWYLEVGYHYWPQAWKTGKFSDSDAVAFLRYDDFDTQHKMPAGVARNPAGNRNEWTLGINLYLTPSFVIKADYQFRDDDTGVDLDHLFNLGVGWQY